LPCAAIARPIVDNCDITGFANNGIEINSAGAFVAINNTRIENVSGVGILVCFRFAGLRQSQQCTYLHRQVRLCGKYAVGNPNGFPALVCKGDVLSFNPPQVPQRIRQR